jgi:hypothetical protein
MDRAYSTHGREKKWNALKAEGRSSVLMALAVCLYACKESLMKFWSGLAIGQEM